MKLFLAASLLLVGSIVAETRTDVVSSAVFRPHRVSLLDLLASPSSSEAGESLLEALQTDGIVAIKNLSPTYSADKNRALSELHECASSPDGHERTKSTTFSDGTVRRTLAARTVPGPGGMQKIRLDHEGSVEGGAEGACENFVEASTPLREAVDAATKAFAKRLGSLLLAPAGKEAIDEDPLLSTEDGSHDFSSFGDVAEAGEHLEHFHSYHRPPASASEKKGENVRKLAAAAKKQDTIELHTDQGLFIAFTPGMMAGLDGVPGASELLVPSGGFYVRNSSGARSLAHFEPDDLIVMLGDGVEQIGINDRLRGRGEMPLLAVPHAMTMPEHDSSETVSRVWHGRMVLPPSGAVHPTNGSGDKTFGDVRRSLIEASLESGAAFNSASRSPRLGLGCSSPVEAARILADEEVSCADDSTYCWHRCMPHADHQVSRELCAQSGSQLQCINPREQVYISGHGDYYPACSNSTALATDYPVLPGYPRDTTTCSADSWNAFASTAGYDHSFDRLGDNRGQSGFWEGASDKGQGKIAKLMWNVADDGKTIEGKLVFNGLFGYLAIGAANEGGKHNGMNGASIIMALPGGDYTAKFGLDLAMDDTVDEYVIDQEGSAFRHWPEHVPNRDTSGYSVESTDCFTSLTFKTDNVNNIPLVNETDGTGALVWAGNPKDSFCGSHGRGQEGRGDRDRFAVNWRTGEGWFPAELELEEETDSSEEGEEDTEDTMGARSSASGMASSIGLAMLGFILTANNGALLY